MAGFPLYRGPIVELEVCVKPVVVKKHMSIPLKHIETCPSCWKKPSFSHFSPGFDPSFGNRGGGGVVHGWHRSTLWSRWSRWCTWLGMVQGSSVGMDVDPQSVGTRHGESPFSMGKWSFLGIRGGFMGFNGKSPCYSGKTDYVYSPCSRAMLNCRRVILPFFMR